MEDDEEYDEIYGDEEEGLGSEEARCVDNETLEYEEVELL
jgi:hypothetical protein